MATVVNPGTKKAEELIHDMNYRHYKGTTLYEVYGSPSRTKVQTWERIKRECESVKGRRLHIVGASCHMYSCIYAFPITDADGVITDMTIRKETRGNTYELVLPVDEYDRRIIHREE